MPEKFEPIPESEPEKQPEPETTKLYKKVLDENNGLFDRRVLNLILDTDPDYRSKSKQSLYRRVMAYRNSIRKDLNEEDKKAKQKRDEVASEIEHFAIVKRESKAKIGRENRASGQLTGGADRRKNSQKIVKHPELNFGEEV